MDFAENLKNARLSAGLTQQQVAESMGITKSTYCGYETGKRQPDVKKIKQLSQILGVPSDVLLGTESGKVSLSVELDRRLLELFHRLNGEGQEKLLDLADDLVSSGKYIKSGSPRLGTEA